MIRLYRYTFLDYRITIGASDGYGDRVEGLSVANVGEVLYTIEGRVSLDEAQRALALIDRSAIQLVNIDRSLAFKAARIKAAEGTGYLDCFAVALAQGLSAAIVTQDADFRRFEGRVQIEWLEQPSGR